MRTLGHFKLRASSWWCPRASRSFRFAQHKIFKCCPRGSGKFSRALVWGLDPAVEAEFADTESWLTNLSEIISSGTFLPPNICTFILSSCFLPTVLWMEILEVLGFHVRSSARLASARGPVPEKTLSRPSHLTGVYLTLCLDMSSQP